jgi:hypothetical protein
MHPLQLRINFWDLAGGEDYKEVSDWPASANARGTELLTLDSLCLMCNAQLLTEAEPALTAKA